MDPSRALRPHVVLLPLATLVLAAACGFNSLGTGASVSTGHGGHGGASSSGTSASSASTSSSGAGGDVSASSSGTGGSGGVQTGSSSSGAAGGDGGVPDGGTPLPLGAAKSFAVLGGSTVTNAGVTTIIVGDVGVSPGTSITGIPPGMLIGVNHGSDAISAQAQLAATAAYNALMLAPCDVTLPTAELGGRTLKPGVYCFGADAVQLTGALLLDAQGDPNARFVFQIAAALTSAANASVGMLNGANACNVYWQIGSAATLGKNTAFSGTIIAYAAVTLMSGVSVTGRLIARTAALSLDTNDISVASCVK